MPDKTPQEIWDAALGEIQVQVSRPNYRTWFSQTSGLAYQNEEFTIGVPNSFVGEYLEKNQLSLIEKALTGVTSAGVSVNFQVKGKPVNYTEDSLGFMPAYKPPATKLNPDYLFESFIQGEGNSLAKASALSVAQNPGHTYNPLFICGGAGLGKTHLLHAIGNLVMNNHVNVICTSAEQFTNEFLTAVRDRKTEEFRNKYRSVGMLLIDDIHFINGKEQTQESFFHTFNELHNTKRQIVVTSDSPPGAMPRLAERLRSRLEWGLVVDIQPPDFETRLAILQAKAQRKGFNAGHDVLEYIARQDRSNVRELEGALNRVVAFAKLLQAAPTLDLAARALRDIATRPNTPRAVTITSILDAVAEYFQIPVDTLLGPKRDKQTSLARRVAMYLSRQETAFPLSQIGLELGNRDAAAVTVACKKVSEDILTSDYLKRKIQEIQRYLHQDKFLESRN
jgi:chromosomal replication initiator protein